MGQARRILPASSEHSLKGYPKIGPFDLSDTLATSFPVRPEIMSDSCLVDFNQRLMIDLTDSADTT
jgi:hypothetical protein